jgi:Icc-related predicted phosphoesterase
MSAIKGHNEKQTIWTKMRIYAVADIHGKLTRIERIRENIALYEPNVLVVAGDITNIKRALTVIKQLNNLNLPVLAVRGNTDLPRVDGLLDNFSNTVGLHLKEHIIDGIHFAGIGGTIPIPFRSQVGFFEDRVLKKLSRLINQNSVVVAHPPPWGILDDAFNRFHAGSKGLYRFIRRYQPRLLLCGHIHEKPGTATVGNSVVVNCNMSRNNAGAIIELVGNQAPMVEMI